MSPRANLNTVTAPVWNRSQYTSQCTKANAKQRATTYFDVWGPGRSLC